VCDISTYVCVCVCMYMYVYVYIYIYIYIYIYYTTHKHTHTCMDGITNVVRTESRGIAPQNPRYERETCNEPKILTNARSPYFATTRQRTSLRRGSCACLCQSAFPPQTDPTTSNRSSQSKSLAPVVTTYFQEKQRKHCVQPTRAPRCNKWCNKWCSKSWSNAIPISPTSCLSDRQTLSSDKPLVVVHKS
jgi:hypothetical protein